MSRLSSMQKIQRLAEEQREIESLAKALRRAARKWKQAKTTSVRKRVAKRAMRLLRVLKVWIKSRNAASTGRPCRWSLHADEPAT